MATVYPTAAGAWSTRTWNNDATGAAYGTTPQPGDIVLANNLAVTIDIDITVASLKTIAGTTAAAGGSFATSGKRTVTADSYAGSTNCLVLTASSNSVQNGNSFGSTTTNSRVGTTVNASCIQNGNSTGGNGSARTGTIVDAGGVQNGNSQGGTSTTAYGTNLLTASAMQNGNATGGSGTASHGTIMASNTIFFGNATGGTASGSHGIAISAQAIALVTAATGNTSGAFGVQSSASSRYVAIIQNESGSFPKSLTAQAETTSANVPFVSFEGSGGGGSSILAYGTAS